MKNLAVRGSSGPDPIDLDALNPPRVVEGTVINITTLPPVPVRATPPVPPVPPRARATESLLPVVLAFLVLMFWFRLCLSIIWGSGA